MKFVSLCVTCSLVCVCVCVCVCVSWYTAVESSATLRFVSLCVCFVCFYNRCSSGAMQRKRKAIDGTTQRQRESKTLFH